MSTVAEWNEMQFRLLLSSRYRADFFAAEPGRSPAGRLLQHVSPQRCNYIGRSRGGDAFKRFVEHDFARTARLIRERGQVRLEDALDAYLAFVAAQGPDTIDVDGATFLRFLLSQTPAGQDPAVRQVAALEYTRGFLQHAFSDAGFSLGEPLFGPGAALARAFGAILDRDRAALFMRADPRGAYATPLAPRGADATPLASSVGLVLARPSPRKPVLTLLLPAGSFGAGPWPDVFALPAGLLAVLARHHDEAGA